MRAFLIGSCPCCLTHCSDSAAVHSAAGKTTACTCDVCIRPRRALTPQDQAGVSSPNHVDSPIFCALRIQNAHKMAYPFDKWRLVRFEPALFPKKYVAVLADRENPEHITRMAFGDRRHDQFRDDTGLALYTHRDHLDSRRRDNYRARHSKDILTSWSPGYLSWAFLWDG